MLCARECPDWCIYIDSHKETIPAPEGGRPRQRNVLDRFAIDFALCMYCGICIEVCPFDALFWSPEFEYAEGDIRNLLHEKDKLATWVPTVPPPPAHDPGAELPKELSAAPRRPARAGAAQSAAPPRTPASERRARTTEKAPTGPAEPPTSAATRPAPAEDAPRTEGTGEAASPSQSEGPTSGKGPAQAEGPGRGGRASAEGPVTEGGQGAGSGPVAGEGAGAAPSGAVGAPSETPSTGEDQSAGADQTPSTDRGPAQEFSTGGESGQELSTGSAESRPEPGPGEQTSGARPRRRRMADPRSIRPPGRLDKEEPREPEEE
ncbi:4Fe-4S binding protein [Nonomuraea sp. NPDC048826]|uniref:4Fe-4S binding protein n=1 Tax=Nonomuraea sp. NPDC048826 TaxID=3364347 RepID=UPI0037230C84